VRFYPAGGGRPIVGTVDTEGNYRAKLPPDDYTVVIQASTNLPEGWREGDPIPPQQVQVPKVYSHRKRSPLSLTVETGDAIEKDFVLE